MEGPMDTVVEFVAQHRWLSLPCCLLHRSTVISSLTYLALYYQLSLILLTSRTFNNINKWNKLFSDIGIHINESNGYRQYLTSPAVIEKKPPASMHSWTTCVRILSTIISISSFCVVLETYVAFFGELCKWVWSGSSPPVALYERSCPCSDLDLVHGYYHLYGHALECSVEHISTQFLYYGSL